MKPIVYIILFFISVQSFGQTKPYFEEIKTDSSEITIRRTSEYKIFEENYLLKDSIFRSLCFSEDTNQLYEEGWMTKTEIKFGIWKEFNQQGELLYEWDYDEGKGKLNQKLLPNHYILEKIKIVSDSILIDYYSQHFYDNHIRFNGKVMAYRGDYHSWKESEGGTYLMTGCGDWLHPFTDTANIFKVNYDIIYDEGKIAKDAIGLMIDKKGNILPYHRNPYGNEAQGLDTNLKTANKTFHINDINISSILDSLNLELDSPLSIIKYLDWDWNYILDNDKIECAKIGYVYNIAIKTGEHFETDLSDELLVEGKYADFIKLSFNPWTGNLTRITKVKRNLSYRIIKDYRLDQYKLFD